MAVTVFSGVDFVACRNINLKHHDVDLFEQVGPREFLAMKHLNFRTQQRDNPCDRPPPDEGWNFISTAYATGEDEFLAMAGPV